MNPKIKQKISTVKTLLDKGKTPREISKQMNISYSSVIKYKNIIKEEFAVELPKEEIVFTAEELPPVDTEKRLEVITKDFMIGKNSFGIRIYNDGEQNYFDYDDLTSAVELGLDKKIEANFVMLKDKKVVDLVSLIAYINQVKDYSFRKSIIDYIFYTDTFSQFYDIINSFILVDSLINNISDKYSEIKNYNNIQLDLLHNIENDNKSDGTEYTKQLKELRLRRRKSKNYLTLANQIKYGLSNKNIHSQSLVLLANRVLETMENLYEGKYNPRADRNNVGEE